MGKYLKAFGHAARAFASANAPEDPQEFEAAGKTIVCSHCANTHFVRIGVNSTILGSIKIPGADGIPSMLICSDCKKIEVFGKRPESISDNDT